MTAPHLRPVPDPNAELAPLDPDVFFDRNGLLVQTTANHVRERVTLGKLRMHRDTDDADNLWYYEGGVWRPAGAREVEHIVADLLGERLRQTHVTNTVLALRTRTDLPTLNDGPPHPEHLNFTNGFLQWSNQEFIDRHDPATLSTVQLAVEWIPDAECPAYDAWVKTVLPDEGVADFSDEVFGYLMMNGNPLHKAINLLGTGRNGKGTMLRFYLDVVGSFNCATVPLQTLSENRFAPAQIHMKLANVAGDIDATHIEKTAMFKMITGEDVIYAERKNGQPFRFVPWAKPIFSANKVPTSADTSEGYLTRWEVIPFPVYLPDLKGGVNPGIEQFIRTNELPGIARRWVRGLARLMARGYFERPLAVAAAFHEFEEKVDIVRAWKRENLATADPGHFTLRTPLFEHFRAWLTTQDRKPMSATTFYDRLEASGVKAARRSGGRGFLGVQLSTPQPPMFPGMDKYPKPQ